jgi:hypothetical protein
VKIETSGTQSSEWSALLVGAACRQNCRTRSKNLNNWIFYFWNLMVRLVFRARRPTQPRAEVSSSSSISLSPLYTKSADFSPSLVANMKCFCFCTFDVLKCVIWTRVFCVSILFLWKSTVSPLLSGSAVSSTFMNVLWRKEWILEADLIPGNRESGPSKRTWNCSNIQGFAPSLNTFPRQRMHTSHCSRCFL